MRNTPTSVETSTGRYVDLLNPDPDTIVLADIAAHLSRIGRYNGACRRFYSVAEHALLVAARLNSLGFYPRTVLLGLHHDSPETYVNDTTRPYKIAAAALSGCHAAASEHIEDAIATAVSAALALPAATLIDRAAIKAADDWALAAEAWHLLPSRGAGWVTEGLYDEDDPCNPILADSVLSGFYLAPGGTEAAFIAEHDRCTDLLERAAA